MPTKHLRRCWKTTLSCWMFGPIWPLPNSTGSAMVTKLPRLRCFDRCWPMIHPTSGPDMAWGCSWFGRVKRKSAEKSSRVWPGMSQTTPLCSISWLRPSSPSNRNKPPRATAWCWNLILFCGQRCTGDPKCVAVWTMSKGPRKILNCLRRCRIILRLAPWSGSTPDWAHSAKWFR